MHFLNVRLHAQVDKFSQDSYKINTEFSFYHLRNMNFTTIEFKIYKIIKIQDVKKETDLVSL